MAEWLKAHAWKVCIRGTVSRVRIPLSPPEIFSTRYSNVLIPSVTTLSKVRIFSYKVTEIYGPASRPFTQISDAIAPTVRIYDYVTPDRKSTA